MCLYIYHRKNRIMKAYSFPLTSLEVVMAGFVLAGVVLCVHRQSVGKEAMF